MLKLRNHNIILPKYLEIVKKKGSSLTFSASGGRDKEKNEKPAEKITVGSEGEAEGGGGGNSARLAQSVPFGYFQTHTANALDVSVDELLK